MQPCKVYVIASPPKGHLQEKLSQWFSLYPDIWHRGRSSHWAVAVWFPSGHFMRYEPGVHNSSLKGYWNVGEARTEEELLYPRERKELVAEVNTTSDAVFDWFSKYQGTHTSEAGGAAREVNADRAAQTLPLTAQRDWIKGFLSTSQDLNKTNLEVPIRRLQAQLEGA